jgi:S1-C subfamily serine protease
MVTALTVVRAATRRPGPTLTVRKGDDRTDVTLWTWDEDHDLALLVAKKGGLPHLPWVPVDQPPDLGERIFDVAGGGSAGGAITQGFVADLSAVGIEHDTPIAGPFTGGPLINSDAQVLGVATPAYRPLGFTSARLTFAAPIRAVCAKLLRCPSDVNVPVHPGDRR